MGMAYWAHVAAVLSRTDLHGSYCQALLLQLLLTPAAGRTDIRPSLTFPVLPKSAAFPLWALCSGEDSRCPFQISLDVASIAQAGLRYQGTFKLIKA